ncbi:MAG TPA: hypothetical protein VHA13_00460 [Gammaproteobacteria bacterium]|nr:hypothetical protein [Gammaproteobacteria bacterium]
MRLSVWMVLWRSMQSRLEVWLKNSYFFSFSSANVYHLLEIKYHDEQYQLCFQEIGKTAILERAPNEIVANDRLLEGFSKQEIRQILYLAYEQEKQPKYKIAVQEFCEKINRILFKLKRRGSDEVIINTADLITLDKRLINDLSQEDACCIGFAAGYELSFEKVNNKEDSSK